MDRILFEKGRFFFLNLFLLNLLGESDRQAQVACRIITSDLPPLHTHTKKGWGSHILSTRLPSVWLFHQSAIGLSLGYFFRISAGPPLLHSIECVSYRLMRRSEARVTPAGRAFAPQVFISNGSTGDRITRRTDGGDIRFELDENRMRFWRMIGLMPIEISSSNCAIECPYLDVGDNKRMCPFQCPFSVFAHS